MKENVRGETMKYFNHIQGFKVMIAGWKVDMNIIVPSVQQ